MLAFDQQSKAVNEVIAAEARKWRDAEKAGTLNPDGKMTLAAKVPITLWYAFRKEWFKLRAKGYDKCWQTFWLKNLKHSPLLQEYRCTDKTLPDVYERDRPVSRGTAPLALTHVKPTPEHKKLSAAIAKVIANVNAERTHEKVEAA